MTGKLCIAACPCGKPYHTRRHAILRTDILASGVYSKVLIAVNGLMLRDLRVRTLRLLYWSKNDMFDVLAFPEEHLMLQNRQCVGMPSASNGQGLDKEAIKISCRTHAHCRVLLSTRCIAGTLPSSWGAVGSFPMLTNVTLANNNLSGSLPTSWGTNLHRIPHFNHLAVAVGAPRCAAFSGAQHQTSAVIDAKAPGMAI